MDAFESIVALFLQEEGYWVRRSVKVPISRNDKRAMGLPSMPTPEVGLVAYNPRKNKLLLIESKSFLDSYGVRYQSFVGGREDSKRYRLFTDKMFQRIVSRRLLKLYQAKGLALRNTKVKFGLAAGKIYSDDEKRLASHFAKKGWELFTPRQIKDRIKALAEKPWENNEVVLTAKLILRK
ncbi:MAG: hypothetical protein WCJ71_10790 [Candidatus Omnitrophota bacterium]